MQGGGGGGVCPGGAGLLGGGRDAVTASLADGLDPALSRWLRLRRRGQGRDLSVRSGRGRTGGAPAGVNAGLRGDQSRHFDFVVLYRSSVVMSTDSGWLKPQWPQSDLCNCTREFRCVLIVRCFG